ncbi:MAG: hypothetical protein QXD62_01845 [Candidatus Woesearchaeota archaeon]
MKMKGLNKKGQFFLLFVILIVAIFAYFIRSSIKKDVIVGAYFIENFQKEIPVIVNYALFNQLDLGSALIAYIQDYKKFLSSQGLNSSILVFLSDGNVTWVYVDKELEIRLLSNGSILNLNSTFTSISDQYFQYVYDGKINTIFLNKYEYFVSMGLY